MSCCKEEKTRRWLWYGHIPLNSTYYYERFGNTLECEKIN
jgi:hypothetical protein